MKTITTPPLTPHELAAERRAVAAEVAGLVKAAKFRNGPASPNGVPLHLTRAVLSSITGRALVGGRAQGGGR